MSKYLNENKIEIFSLDYRKILDNLKKDGFVYLDPPYLPMSASSSSTSYTKEGFNINEQIQLKRECDKLNAKGIEFLLSNSDHPLFHKLYKDYEIITVKAKRFVNSQAQNRQNVNEILIRNYS